MVRKTQRVKVALGGLQEWKTAFPAGGVRIFDSTPFSGRAPILCFFTGPFRPRFSSTDFFGVLFCVFTFNSLRISWGLFAFRQDFFWISFSFPLWAILVFGRFLRFFGILGCATLSVLTHQSNTQCWGHTVHH